MAIMRNNDWKKLIQLCKDQIQKTKGDRGDTRATRGLLYRLTFYISENRLVKPQSRMKQESPIQKGMFGKFDRGVIEEEGTPLSPKEVKQRTFEEVDAEARIRIYDHTTLGPGPYEEKDFGHPGCPICKRVRDGGSISEPAGSSPGEEKEISE